MAVKNGAAGEAYPDKSLVRQDMTDKERIQALEEDQTLTEIKVDDVVAQLKNLRECMARKKAKKKRSKVANGKTEETIDMASAED